MLVVNQCPRRWPAVLDTDPLDAAFSILVGSSNGILKGLQQLTSAAAFMAPTSGMTGRQMHLNYRLLLMSRASIMAIVSALIPFGRGGFPLLFP